MRRIFIFFFTAFLLAGTVRADEGMWLPALVGKMRYGDMRKNGLQIKASDLYDVNRSSLKDAIVLFGSGCTGEIVSDRGLLFTNHHCGYGQIQSHSSVEHDYLTDGFWARTPAEELPNPGLKVKILVRMDDVTKQALKGVTGQMTEPDRQAAVRRNNADIVAAATKGTRYEASVESFYYGNQYFLFVYEVFEDVRLVGAPPSSIGKFGGDTDNWMWPRHTGDFSIFRIYAGKDNKPASYSPDNVPYRPKQFFTISMAGADEGDFTFVYGFPGRTYEYITSDAVDYMVNRGNPHKIALRTIRLDIMTAEQERDAATRIMYASKHASVANAWKKWQGELNGIVRLDVAGRKRVLEEQFTAWAANKPEYGNVLPALEELYQGLDHFAFQRDYYLEAFAPIELTSFAGAFARTTTGEIDAAYTDRQRKAADEFFRNYSPTIDLATAIALLGAYNENCSYEPAVRNIFDRCIRPYGSIAGAVERMFNTSVFVSQDRVERLLALPADELRQKVDDDPAMALYRAFNGAYTTIFLPRYTELSARIELQYRTYMRGLMAMQKDRQFYPDANSTLRVAYGRVDGYKPADGVYYESHTTLDGVMEKDSPEIYDYDVPQRLRDLYAAKDYGRYAVDGTVPVAFIATNHTTGGNSGSPILNGRGELLGLNFDRTWESTMSDVKYDPSICRNISVDIRYVLFVIDRVAGAGYLLDEMRFAE
ncbi:MAG: S46 family peptidase [Rikenellaceae bacterium]|jgi:hypothetical protein|nr:S46 family peptidase [Rikenellaceae bacterium]